MTHPAAQDIIALYERRAADWDADRGRNLFEKPWLDRFLARVRPGGKVLDIGCGSGEPIARYLIGQGVALTGLDGSAALIGLCRERFPKNEWIVGDMREMDAETFDIGAFDGLIAWHSFFHLSPEDQRQMIPVLARHASPGAALMFTSGSQHGEEVGEWRGDPLYHGSLDEAEYATLLDASGFDVDGHVRDDADCGGATVWLCVKRA